MLHQPATHFPSAPPPPTPGLNAKRRPVFDAAAYVAAMHAAGAVLRPERGKPGNIHLDGTYCVELPTEPLARGHAEAVDAAFASSREADPVAVGRIAQHLLDSAATERFVRAAGDELASAMSELARLREKLRAVASREETADADDSAILAADIVGKAYCNAVEHVLTMPIRRRADIGLKADFALRHCLENDDGLKRIRDEIVAFERSGLAADRRGEQALPAPETQAAPGIDLAAALRELERLDREMEAAAAADDAASYSPATTVAVEAAQRRLHNACEIVLALPIRRPEDIAVKAEIAARYCWWGDELQTVLVEIATFGAPGRVDRIVPKELIG